MPKVLSSSNASPFLSAYGPKPRLHALQFPESEGPHGRTKQSFKDESDINNIMARYNKTGVLEYTARYQPRYADVTGADFTSSMQKVALAKSMFNALPAFVRDRFSNDPARFLEFVQNPANEAEAIELGLLKKGAESPPQPADAPASAELPADASAAGGDALAASKGGSDTPPKGGKKGG